VIAPPIREREREREKEGGREGERERGRERECVCVRARDTWPGHFNSTHNACAVDTKTHKAGKLQVANSSPARARDSTRAGQSRQPGHLSALFARAKEAYIKAKVTYIYGKRLPHIRQKRTTYKAKETY